MVPDTRTVDKKVTSTVMVPVNRTIYVNAPFTESKPVTTTRQEIDWVADLCGTIASFSQPGGSAQASGGCAHAPGTCASAPGGCAPLKPLVRTIAETHMETVTTLRPVPVQQVCMVPQVKVDTVPVNVCYERPELRTEIMSVTREKVVPELVSRVVPVAIAEQVALPTTAQRARQELTMETHQTPVSIPEQVPITVATVRAREVTEMVTRRVPVSVAEPFQITVMRTKPRQVTEMMERQVPYQVPEEAQITVMTSRPRDVTEMVTRQVAVRVPEQVNVTVMTTRPREVTEMTTRQVTHQVPEQVCVTVMSCRVRQVTRQVPVTKTEWVPATAGCADGSGTGAVSAEPQS
jgi:hypothetical protein